MHIDRSERLVSARAMLLAWVIATFVVSVLSLQVSVQDHARAASGYLEQVKVLGPAFDTVYPVPAVSKIAYLHLLQFAFLGVILGQLSLALRHSQDQYAPVDLDCVHSSIDELPRDVRLKALTGASELPTWLSNLLSLVSSLALLGAGLLVADSAEHYAQSVLRRLLAFGTALYEGASLALDLLLEASVVATPIGSIPVTACLVCAYSFTVAAKKYPGRLWVVLCAVFLLYGTAHVAEPLFMARVHSTSSCISFSWY